MSSLLARSLHSLSYRLQSALEERNGRSGRKNKCSSQRRCQASTRHMLVYVCVCVWTVGRRRRDDVHVLTLTGRQKNQTRGADRTLKQARQWGWLGHFLTILPQDGASFSVFPNDLLLLSFSSNTFASVVHIGIIWNEFVIFMDSFMENLLFSLTS